MKVRKNKNGPEIFIELENCTEFRCFDDGSGTLQATLERVARGYEEYKRFGKDFVIYEKDIDRLKRDFPEKDITYSFICKNGSNENDINKLRIDMRIPMRVLVQKGYLKPMDTCCE